MLIHHLLFAYFGSRFEKAINRGGNNYSLKNHNLVSMKNNKYNLYFKLSQHS